MAELFECILLTINACVPSDINRCCKCNGCKDCFDECNCSIEESTKRVIFQIMNIICAGALIVFAIIDFNTKGWIAQDYIWFVYWIMFGVLIIASQFQVDVIFDNLGFLQTNKGKGYFYIFCGTMPL